MSGILISIIICSYNREKYIIEALESLVFQDFDRNAFEVIVVDNNSTDQTSRYCREYIEAHPDYLIYYFNEPSQGSSFARNTGAGHAKGELLVFMDDDAQALPGLLKATWAFHRDFPGIEGFGGKIIPKFIPDAPGWMSHYVSSLVGNFDYGNEIKKFSSNKYPLESNMAVTRLAFKELGGFNPALPGVKGNIRIGGEGKDLFFRLSARYGDIYYVPGMQVYHVVEVNKLTAEYLYRVASGIGRGERLRIGKSFLAYILKWSEYIFKLGASVLIGLYYFLQGHRIKMKPVIQFRIDVLKGFIGN